MEGGDGASDAVGAGGSLCWLKTHGVTSTYHLDRGISQVDELGEDLAVLASGIKLGGVPEGEDSADELGKAFCPCSVGIGFALCKSRC